MARVFLFATIGGALVVICWMALRYLLSTARKKAEEHRELGEAEDRIRLVSKEPGGSADNPILIKTPSVVESMATSGVCPRCQGSTRVLEHQARQIHGKRFRVAIVQCTMCGFEREVFFYIET